VAEEGEGLSSSETGSQLPWSTIETRALDTISSEGTELAERTSAIERRGTGKSTSNDHFLLSLEATHLHAAAASGARRG
jgi:hypothetical protein